MKIIQSPSQNYSDRNGQKPEIVVVHCTEGAFPGDLNWLTSYLSEVSSHYLIAPNGDVHQLVPESKAAWHAGSVVFPTFKGLKLGINPNQYSIGIEVSLTKDAEMTEFQKKSLYELITDICKRNSIAVDRMHIIGHKEIRSNKTCPGKINIDSVVIDLNNVNSGQIDKVEIKRQIIELLNKL